MTGRTRWRRFFTLFVLGLAGCAALLVCMSRGVLAASFTVSGVSFKISAGALQGSGVVLDSATERNTNNAAPVAATRFRSVVLDDFCQSVFLPKVPLVGDVTLRLVSAGSEGMAATDIVLGAAEHRRADDQVDEPRAVHPDRGVLTRIRERGGDMPSVLDATDVAAHERNARCHQNRHGRRDCHPVFPRGPRWRPAPGRGIIAGQR